MPSSSKASKQAKINQNAFHGSDTLSMGKQHKDSSSKSLGLSLQARPTSITSNKDSSIVVSTKTEGDVGLESPTPRRCDTSTPRDRHSVTTIDTSPDTPPDSPVEPSKELVAAVKKIASAVSLPQISSATDLIMHSSSAQGHLVGGIVQQGNAANLLQQFVDLLKAAVKPDASAEQTSANSPPSELSTQKPTTEKVRASKATYLSVKEVWNKKNCSYEIVQATKAEEVCDFDEYLFVVRARTSPSTEKITKYVDIKSTSLQHIIQLVMKDVRVVSVKEDRPSIEQNFLFNFVPEIAKYRADLSQRAQLDTSDDRAETDAALKHLDVLLSYLETEYGPVQDRLRSLLKSGEITYDLLWTIFKPNVEIYTTCLGTGAPRCVKCVFGEERKRNNGTKYFCVECRYLDFDGENFGEATIALAIEYFYGAKQITLLPAHPLSCRNYGPELKKLLIQRGQEFASLFGVHHRAYEGKAFFIDQKGRLVVQSIIKSRIMIDPKFFSRRNPNYQIAKVESASGFDSTSIANTSFWNEVDEEEEAQLKILNKDPTQLSDSDLLICSPTVRGFSFEKKKWLEFAIANMRYISWNDKSFDLVALPEKTKKAVKALAQAHMNRRCDIPSDLVAGKGRGLITLLHGPPGVGKTLTAETLSELLHRPFYTVSAGELGTTSETLEENLSTILELSAHWNAVLLLDEADVFVERRSTSDVQRNALVSIFLRKIEYYDGIMFLTTNRAQTMDEAFASRIHMPIKYDWLSESARTKVWETCLAKANTRHGKAVYTPEELKRLTRKKLNGREITNITSTAQAMASSDGNAVSFSYLEDAINLGERFQMDYKGAGHFEAQASYV